MHSAARVLLPYISACSVGEVLQRTLPARQGTDAEMESPDCRAHEARIKSEILVSLYVAL